MALRAEHIADLIDPAENTGKILLVKLRRLRKVRLLTEIAQLEDVGTALGAGRNDLRRGHVHEALLAHILGESFCNGSLNAEDCLHARVAQGDRTVVQIGFQIDTHIFLAQRNRHLFIWTGEHMQVGEYDFKAVLGADFLADIAGDLDDHGIADFTARNAADGVGLYQTLNQSSVDADDNKRELGHVTDTMNRAAEGDRLIEMRCSLGDGIDICFWKGNGIHRVQPHLLVFNLKLQSADAKPRKTKKQAYGCP